MNRARQQGVASAEGRIEMAVKAAQAGSFPRQEAEIGLPGDSPAGRPQLGRSLTFKRSQSRSAHRPGRPKTALRNFTAREHLQVAPCRSPFGIPGVGNNCDCAGYSTHVCCLRAWVWVHLQGIGTRTYSLSEPPEGKLASGSGALLRAFED